MGKKVLMTGWRYRLFIGGIVGVTALAVVSVTIYPIMHLEEYKEIQKKTRAGVRQEDIQPGNMKVWSDPFERK